MATRVCLIWAMALAATGSYDDEEWRLRWFAGTRWHRQTLQRRCWGLTMDESPKDAGQEEHYGRLIYGAAGRSAGVCGSMLHADGNACCATTDEYAQANRCLEKWRQVLSFEREGTVDDRYTRTCEVEVYMQCWLRRFRRWLRRSG